MPSRGGDQAKSVKPPVLKGVQDQQEIKLNWGRSQNVPFWNRECSSWGNLGVRAQVNASLSDEINLVRRGFWETPKNRTGSRRVEYL